MTSHTPTLPKSRPAAMLLLGAAFLVGFILTVAPAPVEAAVRGTTCYTAWDDYFFYAAFQVDDPRVNSVNNTPLSQPQQDDDIEVFFDTKGAKTVAARLPGTYQMAVSAGNGAYFSVGDASGKPQPKLVFTYKYAATVDGTLNANSDTDLGYTVEMAIPWNELGLTGPPAPGTVWGFNVINRDRQTASAPANRLGSLSPGVTSAAGVQNPQDWTQITFTNSLTSQPSGAAGVICPLVQGHYPTVDGVVRSGEYFRADGFSIGPPTIAAAAPTSAEEPNVDISANDAFNQAISATPQPAVVAPGQAATVTGSPQAPPATTSTTPAPAPMRPKPTPGEPNYDIQLPGGGTVHIGKLQPPPAPALPPPAQTLSGPVPKIPTGKRNGKGASSSGNQVAQLPTGGYGPQFPTVGPDIDTNQSLRLLEQPRVAPLFLARYESATTSQSLFGAVDQPMSGGGSWFGGGSVQYDIDQMKDARRAGVDTLLVDYDPSNAIAGSSLLTLVQALQEMRSAGQDYPLLALHLMGIDAAAQPDYSGISSFFRRVPPEFRAVAILPDVQDNAPEYIVLVDEDDATGLDIPAIRARFQQDFAGEGAGLFLGTLSGGKIVGATGDADVSLSPVTPVSGSAPAPTPALARDQGASYNSSWGAADSAGADWALLDSWNNYAHGTEVAATRQYGEQYADLTKLYSLQWNGGQPWRARYLKAAVPSVMSPNVLYTVQVRVENAGTLPWRVGDVYSLGYRWYKDGRLYDDSAPRLPIDANIYPGQSTTLNVAILPHNQYGNAIEPGNYTLVFDMVQDDDRWFVLAGDIGLKTHVRVAAATEAIEPRVTFLSSTLPTRIASGVPYTAHVTFRNDGTTAFKAGSAELGYTASLLDGGGGTAAETGQAELTSDLAPGAVQTVAVQVKIGAGVESSDGVYQLKWNLVTPAAAGHLMQVVQTVAADDGASFVLSDIPRNLKTGEMNSAQLGILNRGPVGWTGEKWQVGYHWTYLDGTIVPDSIGGAPILTPLLTANNPLVAPNVATAVIAKFRAPSVPGRYYLVWNVRDPQGNWSSELGQKMHPGASLPAMVTVTESGGSDARIVDISKYYNVTAYGFEGSEGGDFDGNANAIPGDQMPPDGAGDMVSNPVLVGKPGPAYYPSGFYAPGHAADHSVAFYFPDSSKVGANAVSCQGQRIDLPGGYASVHLLAAATGDAAASVTFILNGSTPTPRQMTIYPWTQAPEGTSAATALSFPYRLHQGVVDATLPCVLGDYEIALPAGTRSITLPTSTDVKVLALTVARPRG